MITTFEQLNNFVESQNKQTIRVTGELVHILTKLFPHQAFKRSLKFEFIPYAVLRFDKPYNTQDYILKVDYE